jgi:DNA repair photolyase
VTPGPDPPKGRGATANPEGRFEPRRVEAVWDDRPGESAPSPATEVFVDHARTVLTRNDSPDVPFDVSINPYRGCEHGCAYCFARPSHAYLNLSPGLDFETKIFAKPDAPQLLARELAKPGYRCVPIALGTNTDPYQPIERTLRITRGILEVLVAHRHPFSIVTKSALVLRDLDLIAPMAASGQASAFVSITTQDADLAGRLEPRAAAPHRRLEVLRALAGACVPAGVLASPMIPGLNDHELESILGAAASAGARYAGYILIRLPHEVKEVFADWLERHASGRAAKVLSLIRQARGGKLYDPRFGGRMRGEGPYAAMLARRFEVARRRHGFDLERPRLDTAPFHVPGRPGAQRGLFAATNAAMRDAIPS